MSLRALRHFVVVAEELHMHRAAERLHIAQPALSQQIKQLEQRLGVVLFSRANRRLTLTAAGEAFLHKTRLALEMADQAVLDAQRTARGEQGRLHLGYVSSAMYDSKLPGLLRRLRADWPGIELSLVQGGCANALRSAVGSASGYRHHPRAAGLAAGRAGGQAVCT